MRVVVQVGTKGAKVSLMLRQRVSLARTLVRNTPIVILDDPTSAQDGIMVSQVSGNLPKVATCLKMCEGARGGLSLGHLPDFHLVRGASD